MKTGIVLEGGAMRGMFTAGVIDVMMEAQVRFDGAIGVSAGAVFGCNLKSLQTGRVIRYNKNYCKDWRYCSFKSLRKTGDLYGAEFCYDTLPNKLDPFDVETYRSNPLKFYAVATDVETGDAVYQEVPKGTGEDMQWFRASASMPLLSRPVMIGGRGYVDGGCSDSIPIRKFEEMGYQRNVVVLTRPDTYRKKTSKLFPLIRFGLRKYPALARIMETRADRYNQVVEELLAREAAGDPNLLIIRPPEEVKIGKMEKDPAELERVYQMGRQTCREMLTQIERFCSERED